MKKQTSIVVRFIMSSPLLDPDKLTSIIEIEPSSMANKGDVPEGGKVPAPEGFWELKYKARNNHLFHIGDAIEHLVNELIPKKERLKEIIQKDSLKVYFSIITVIENNQSPSFVLNKNLISFFNELGAEVDLDIYVNPYADV